VTDLSKEILARHERLQDLQLLLFEFFNALGHAL
jgi:hypothetical protein